MKRKKTSRLRILKGGKKNDVDDYDLKKTLRDVHLDMKEIVDLIDSNMEKEDRIPPIAQ